MVYLLGRAILVSTVLASPFLAACNVLVGTGDAADPSNLPFAYDSGPIHAKPANTPPVANFTVTPPIGSAGIVLVLNASTSHDAEDPLSELTFRWDFYGDGHWDVDWSPRPTATIEAGPPGSIRIVLEVRDSGFLSNSYLRDVQIVGTSTPLLARGLARILFYGTLVILGSLGAVYVMFRLLQSPIRERRLTRGQSGSKANRDLREKK